MAESLRYGIVSTSDMYYFPDDMAAAISDSGAKNNFSRSVTCFDDRDLMDLPAGREMVHAFETYNGAADGRIKVDMSLHAEYTNPDKIVRQLAELTASLGANMHVHVSETKAEHEECKARHEGRTPVKYLDDCGLFATPTTAAHCVWIEGEDYDILKERGVTVAVNPISNLKLASGVCNVPALFEKGINVAIGTDSVSSNNSLNYIEEMKVFAIASKMMYHAPEAVSPAETLRAATIGGAKSQGRADCGMLKEGYKADLVMIDIDTPWMYPVHNLVTNLVYSASGSDVVMTMVDGRVLYENGEYTTIDIEKTKAAVTRFRKLGSFR
jgi:5-methylthioadenosine/S-adenosylhomocysteine deaminase